MKIFSWNVNGLRSVMSKTFSEFLSAESPDVLCLQETRVSAELEASIELPFKNVYFSHAQKKGYAGTAVMTNLDCAKGGAYDLDGLGGEGRISSATIGDVEIISVYVPNSQAALARLGYRMEWDRAFVEYLKGKKNLIVCGDFNVAHEDIDIYAPDEHRGSNGFSDEERADFGNLLKGVPLVDAWRAANPDVAGAYTWWSYRTGARRRNSGWRIDYALVSPDIMPRIKNVAILAKTEGSDHCPVMLEID